MARHRKSGAYVVRAGGSFGLFDYLALFPTYVLFVQVKSNRWPDHTEMLALHAFKPPYYGYKIIERWNDYAKEPIIREVI